MASTAQPGVAMQPSTRVGVPSAAIAVTSCGRPLGPGMNLPYGSARIIGMLSPSRSSRMRPSFTRACSCAASQVARPPSSAVSRMRSGPKPSRRRPLDCTTPFRTS